MDGRVHREGQARDDDAPRVDVGFGATLGPMPSRGRVVPRADPNLGQSASFPRAPFVEKGAPPAPPSEAARLGRELRAARDELEDARAVALAGMEAHAELLWARRALASFREIARYHERAARARERAATARDDRVRERLRALGLWRLMSKLGLDVRVSNQSACAMRAWLEAVRRRARAEGRAPPLGQSAATASTAKVSAKFAEPRGDSSEPDSSSDDGEPGTRRWRDAPRRVRTRSANTPERRIRDDARARDARDEDASDGLDGLDDDGDGSSVFSYSTLASTALDETENFENSEEKDEGHGARFRDGGSGRRQTTTRRKDAERSFHTKKMAPSNAAPGIRAADLARLARAAPPASLGGAGSEAVLAWRERAAAAAAELEAMSAARFEAEQALRARRRDERAERAAAAEAEEALRGEIETLRERVKAGEARHRARLEAEAAEAAAVAEASAREEASRREKLAARARDAEQARDAAEGELRELQRSSREAMARTTASEEDAVSVASVLKKENARLLSELSCAEEETSRRARLERDVAALRLESERKESAWREKLALETEARDALERAHAALRDQARAQADELETARSETRRAIEASEAELRAARADRDDAERAAREASDTSRASRDAAAEAAAERERDLEARVAESSREMLAGERAWQKRLAEAEAAAAAAARESAETEARGALAAARAEAVSAREEASRAEAAVAEATTSAETRTVSERAALESAASEARAAAEAREASLRAALDAEAERRAEAERSLRDAARTSRARESEMERALAQAREHERAASDARAGVAATLAAKETELAELASLEAAASAEAKSARAAEAA